MLAAWLSGGAAFELPSAHRCSFLSVHTWAQVHASFEDNKLPLAPHLLSYFSAPLHSQTSAKSCLQLAFVKQVSDHTGKSNILSSAFVFLNFSAAFNIIEQTPILGKSFLLGFFDPTPLSIPSASQVTFVGLVMPSVNPSPVGWRCSPTSPLSFSFTDPAAYLIISKLVDNLCLRFHIKTRSLGSTPYTHIFLQLRNDHHIPCLSEEFRRHS